MMVEASGAYGTPSGTSSNFVSDDFVNDTSNPNGQSARVNIYGTTIGEYLISPEFNQRVTYYLNFDIGLVNGILHHLELWDLMIMLHCW